MSVTDTRDTTDGSFDTPHTEGDYATSDVCVADLVPEGFTHDDTLELGRGVNYIFEDEQGNVARISIKMHPQLWGMSVYGNNKSMGVSQAFEVRDPDNLQERRDEVFENLNLM